MIIRPLLGIATAALLVGAFAAPASADSGATALTLTVVGGSLSITVPAATDLGSVQDTVAGSTVSVLLGQVQVTDARSAAAGSGWVTSVIATAFTPAAGPTIAASRISYTAGAMTKVGTATYTANDPGDLTGVSAAVTATGITGDNSATWNPTIHVAVPGGTVATTYTAIITHSVV